MKTKDAYELGVKLAAEVAGMEKEAFLKWLRKWKAARQLAAAKKLMNQTRKVVPKQVKELSPKSIEHHKLLGRLTKGPLYRNRRPSYAMGNT